ncbi:AceR1 [Couchioplanes caeruleus subsp. caeruleus]|uniref:AceR1 n=2 Tax=Couchioplanes caeruleus TaxID=56438 RepID=A0A1K0FTZ0_9ACTN|nr:AceR1 [Couchioplanes caeruleus subsp. caeruleus]
MAHLDRTLAIQHANPEFFRRFGETSASLCGRRFADLIHPSLQAPILRNFSHLLEGKHHRFASRVIALRGDDEPLTGTLTGVAVQGGAPDATGVLVLMRPHAEDVDESAIVRRKPLLSKIDAKILEGIAAGLSTIPLASRLFLSRQGVEYHVSGLLRKLKVPNRAALVSRAYSMGVLIVGVWPPKVVEDFVK